MTADARFWRERDVLITGHTGFKGAWLAAVLSELGANVTGVALPPVRGGIYDAADVGSRVDSRIHDIRDRDSLRATVIEVQPEVVFHLAAQAVVSVGYADPLGTFETNVLGTANLLDAVGDVRSVREVLVVTSDKVYANDGRGRPFSEGDSLGGGDPYSSSKAACELVVGCWRSLLAGRDIRVVSARAGNVIGGGDVAPDRLLPDVFRALEADGCVRLRHPESTRPWQFVLDAVFGYLTYVERLAADPSLPPALNFGPSPSGERTARDLVEAVLRELGEGRWEPTAARPGPEAATLPLDATLAAETLGWRPALDLDSAVQWTCEWFRTSQARGDVAALCADQITRYRALVGR